MYEWAHGTASFAIMPLTNVMEGSMPADAVQRFDPLLIPAAFLVSVCECIYLPPLPRLRLCTSGRVALLFPPSLR
jgi:hypothetical protein